MKRLSLAGAVGAIALWAAPAVAQSTTCPDGTGVLGTNAVACVQMGSVSVTVNDVMKLTLTNPATTLTTPTEATYGVGNGPQDAGPTANVNSNRAFVVTVVAAPGQSGKWSATGTGSNQTKSVADLAWGIVAGTYGHDMSGSATLYNGSTGAFQSTKQIFYKTTWNWGSDTPGSYSMNINFTLSTP